MPASVPGASAWRSAWRTSTISGATWTKRCGRNDVRRKLGSPDPVSVEVFQHLFSGIAEEMGAKLRRSAFSPNIKERRDFSCAVFDDEGRQLAQAAHIPVHLGSTPAS